uniref:Uncharacterized protein n=1 Tax=Strongyloides stercoralis TaxID=6248 RepID=A0AAF5DAV5_STRER
MVSEDNITYIYKNHDETEDRVIDLNKIVFYISLQKLEKNKIITVIDIHIPYQYTYETGLTSFEIFQVHSCNEKYAFIKKDTKALIINSLNQLKKNDFSDENLSIIILTSYGKYSELTIQPYFYPPLNTKKIYNLQYINITYFSDNIDTINIVKKPIYKRKELPSGEMPGFDPTNIVFDKHKVIKYSPKVIENMIIFKNIIYPKLIFFYHTLITAEDIIYVTNPLEYVKSNPTKISYNISYQKKDIEKYELKVNVVLPISFISYDALKFFKINAIYPIGYDFIIPTLKSTIMIAIDNSTLLLLDDYPYVTKRSDSVTDSIFLDSKKMEIECWETINEAINIDNFIVLPKEYKNDVVLNKLRKENKDIIFFNYKISKFNDKKRDFYTEVYLNKNSVLNDGTFKYNCKINVPDVMKNNINNILLSYIIEKPKPSDDLELNYDEILIKGVDKTFFNIYYHSPLIKKNQVKSKKILSISEIEEYRQMDTSDINVLLLLVKNSNYGTYKFNIYVIIPYEYMNENFGQPITIVPSYSSTNKLLQSASIEYIIANNHKYINDIKKFSYDIQILEHNEQIRITHKPNIKKLYIKLNGKSIKKEDVDVYYKNDLTLKPIKNNSKTNVIIEFDRTNIGNVYVKANIKIPHNFLIKDDDPTILIIHDVDPYYNVSQRIKTITTYDEGEPQSYCSVIGINDECEKFIVPFEERINLISGKVPRLYIFLKTDKISPDNI